MAAERAREGGVADAVRLVRSSIQELDGTLGERFDVVACHAALEWLADPRAVVA